MRRILVSMLAAGLAMSVPAGPALAWGGSGHRMIGQAAALGLAKDVAPFLHKRTIPDDIGELSREPDRIRGAGKAIDADGTPGHFLDLDDQGRALGGPPLSALPPTRADYETALRAAGTDSWKAGYLPYSITQYWQRLAKDFGLWRVADAGARTVKDRKHRAWLKADARRREALILDDIGFLSHFVGDGSQPLHVSVHFNGWGDYPNPDGFSQDKLHAPFESDFVSAHVSLADIQARMTPLHDCGCPIEQRTAAYLAATGEQVRPLYVLWGQGAFKGADQRGVAFAADRLAAGASELRDLIELAWAAGASTQVGWPVITLSDVTTGKVDPYAALHGAD